MNRIFELVAGSIERITTSCQIADQILVIKEIISESIHLALKMIEKGSTDLRGDGVSTDLDLETGTVEE